MNKIDVQIEISWIDNITKFNVSEHRYIELTQKQINTLIDKIDLLLPEIDEA